MLHHAVVHPGHASTDPRTLLSTRSHSFASPNNPRLRGGKSYTGDPRTTGANVFARQYIYIYSFSIVNLFQNSACTSSCNILSASNGFDVGFDAIVFAFVLVCVLPQRICGRIFILFPLGDAVVVHLMRGHIRQSWLRAHILALPLAHTPILALALILILPSL